MILYHGSNKVLRQPLYGGGRREKDFGSAFYCTEADELAREWAAVNPRGGFVNSYEADLTDMNCLDLRPPEGKTTARPRSLTTEQEEIILIWTALLINYREIRTGSPTEQRGREYLMQKYLPDLEGVDAIIAWRADNSFFSFVRAFLSNTITLGQLSRALVLEDPGIQYALRSRRAFDRIRFLEAQPVDGSVYYPRRILRDQKTREAYQKMMETEAAEGPYLSELIKKEQ